MNEKSIQRYEHQSSVLIREADAIMIVDQATREIASEFSSKVRATIKSIEEEFNPDIKAAHDLHKSLLDRKSRLIAPFEDAKKIVDNEIRRDFLERKREQEEAERKAREAAEEERRRQEAELAQEASECIENGDLERAEELAGTEVVVRSTVPVPKVGQTVKSDAGTTTVRMDITVDVQDKMAVVKAVAEGKLPDTLVDINLGMAKRYAKAGGLKSMPGFVITETPVVSGRVGR